jgi:hypothetical protein
MDKSPNGIQWTVLSSLNGCSNLIRSDELNLWVVFFSASTVNRIYRSTDTLVWTLSQNLPNGSPSTGLAFSLQRNTWVAVNLGVIYYSTDAITFNLLTVSNGLSFTSVNWLPELGLFFATLTGGGAGAVTYGTSPDGIAWTMETKIFQTSGVATSSGWNGTLLYVSGTNATSPIVSSTDASNFISVGTVISTITPNAICYGVEYGRWVFGAGSTIVSMDASTGTLLTSLNSFTSGAGTRFAAKYTVSNVPVSPNVTAYNADFVVLGTGSSINAYSMTQGRTYVKSNLGLGSNDVAYSANTNTWISVGTSCGISTNGVTWTSIPSLTTLLGTVFGIGRSENRSTWIAGGGGTNKIATSTNGTTWIARSSPFTTQVNHIAYSKQLNVWVAAGSGNASIASSSDNGVTWVSRVPFTSSIAGIHVTWATELGLFLVSMSGSVGGSTTSTATSSDGITWILAARAFQPQSSTFGSAWNGTLMYLGGTSSSNTLMTSTNALNFTGLGSTIFNTQSNGMCYGTLFNRWMLLGGSTFSGYSISSIDGSTIIHTDQTVGNRCATRYTNATSTT